MCVVSKSLFISLWGACYFNICSDIVKIAPIKVRMCAFTFFVSFYTIILYCFTLKLLQILTLKVCRMYNMFGFGAAHGIYVQFIYQSGVHNNGKRIGIIRVAVPRFAIYFYGMMRLVRLQAPMIETIHQEFFYDINLNDRVRSAVMDIENKTFWMSLYTLLRSVYPSIRALCYCESNVPAMDKIYHLYNCTTLAIEKSCENLNDDDLFGPIDGNSDGLEFERTEVFFPEVNNARRSNTITSSNRSDDEITDEDKPMTLGSKILFQWEQRKKKLYHDYSIAGWDLSVIPEVRDDVLDCMAGIYLDAIKRVVTNIHKPPCPKKSKGKSRVKPSVISCTCFGWSSRIFSTRQVPLINIQDG